MSKIYNPLLPFGLDEVGSFSGGSETDPLSLHLDQTTPQTTIGSFGFLPVDSTNFNNNLSPTDDTIQKALDTIDDIVIGSGGGGTSLLSSYFRKESTNENTSYSAINETSNIDSNSEWVVVKIVKLDNNYQYRTLYTAEGAWSNKSSLTYTLKKSYQN